jgi:hypothetical protein
LRERDASRSSRSATFEEDWFLNVTHVTVARCVLRQRQPYLDFCATRKSCDNKVQKLVFFFIVVLLFYFCSVCLYFSQDEMDNVPPKSENFPEFCLTIHQTTSYQISFLPHSK